MRLPDDYDPWHRDTCPHCRPFFQKVQKKDSIKKRLLRWLTSLFDF
jgi:hypothetical protein